MTNRQAFGGGMSEEGYGTLIINGGRITIDADGDGLDSNGTIEITGGYTIVYGPSDSANGALDYGSSCTVSGGTLVAVGASGMAQDTGDSSTPPGLMLYFSGTLSSRDVVSITDSEEFVEGESVSVYLNGEKSGDIELTSGVNSATVSSGSLSESSGGGGMGGDMNGGGMNGGDMGGGRMR